MTLPLDAWCLVRGSRFEATMESRRIYRKVGREQRAEGRARTGPEGERGRKLDALRAATRHSYPTGPVEGMLVEIESGYLGVRPTSAEDDEA